MIDHIHTLVKSGENLLQIDVNAVINNLDEDEKKFVTNALGLSDNDHADDVETIKTPIKTNKG